MLALVGAHRGGGQTKTGGGDHFCMTVGGPRRRNDNSMVRFLFLSCQSGAGFPRCCLVWAGLACAAPHGHSVFSTVSPHARPHPDWPTNFWVCSQQQNVLNSMKLWFLKHRPHAISSPFLTDLCLPPSLASHHILRLST